MGPGVQAAITQEADLENLSDWDLTSPGPWASPTKRGGTEGLSQAGLRLPTAMPQVQSQGASSRDPAFPPSSRLLWGLLSPEAALRSGC